MEESNLLARKTPHYCQVYVCAWPYKRTTQITVYTIRMFFCCFVYLFVGGWVCNEFQPRPPTQDNSGNLANKQDVVCCCLLACLLGVGRGSAMSSSPAHPVLLTFLGDCQRFPSLVVAPAPLSLLYLTHKPTHFSPQNSRYHPLHPRQKLGRAKQSSS